MATLMNRLGQTAVRHRYAVLAVWLFVLLAAGTGAFTLAGKTVDTFSIPGQESTTALDLIGTYFGKGATGASAQVAVQAPAGMRITDPSVAAGVATAVARLRALPGVASVTDPPLISRDGLAASITVQFTAAAPDITQAQRDGLTGEVDRLSAGGLPAGVSGDATRPRSDVGAAGEIIGVVVAMVVLALTYSTLVAAGMNLLTAIVGVAVGSLGITTLTGFVDLQSTTPILAVMLGLAVGIDYALFIFTRFRHELRAGRTGFSGFSAPSEGPGAGCWPSDVPDAVATAVATAGSAVVTAGVTVVIALAGLAVAGIPFLTEMGLAAAGTVVIAVLVAITLVPAVLAVIGNRALPKRDRRGPRRHAVDRGFFRRWAALVTNRRWTSLLTAAIALAVIAIPVFAMRTTLNQPPAKGSTQADAAQIIAGHFGAGFSGPLLVLVDGDGATATAATVAPEIATRPGVAFVAPPRPDGAGTAALITVIPTSAPDSQATVDLVNGLRDAFGHRGGARVRVTGATAVSVDVSQKLRAALPVYLVLVVGLALVLLILVFSSLLVPAVGVLGFLLTIGSTLGATTAVFQWGWLAGVVRSNTTGPLMSLSPIIVIGILFGLAMDYQVFLVSRMREAYAHGEPPRAAVVTGLRQAAPVVVAAASIMFAVFAGFVPQGDQTVKPIAFALALGVLIDAVLVRMVLMPAALSLLGGAAWWLPRWLRWLPSFDVEGSGVSGAAGPAILEDRDPEFAAP